MLKNKINCGFSDEIISYIYKEIDAAGAGEFENHLAGCTSCTDEFAAVSDSRFSVFEWRKEEFAHLATPRIAIPYPGAHGETAGFLNGLRGLFAVSSWPVTAAAALAVCLGLGFLAILFTGSDPQIAANSQDRAVPPVVMQNTLDDSRASRILDSAAMAEATLIKESIETPSRPVRKTVKRQALSAKPLTPKQTPRSNERVQRNQAPAGTAPVLSQYDEDADKTLRLTDLFDDGGR